MWGGIYKLRWDILKSMIIKLPKEDELVMMCRKIAFVGHYQRYESYKWDDEESKFHKWGANF